MHVIRSVINPQDFWSNEYGWIATLGFTVFTDEEKERMALPMDGFWEEYDPQEDDRVVLSLLLAAMTPGKRMDYDLRTALATVLGWETDQVMEAVERAHCNCRAIGEMPKGAAPTGKAYARTEWRAGDVQTLCSYMNDDEAEEWLARNAKYLQEAMVSRGWSVMVDLLAGDDLAPDCDDGAAAGEDCVKGVPAEFVTTLMSSHGEVKFDRRSGVVLEVVHYDPGHKENLQEYKRVDLEEWRARYPGREMGPELDILDMGLWYNEAGGVETYEPPAEEWRTGELRQTRKNDNE